MKIPHHLGIIMDGNGRWAESRGHTRIVGHVKGTRQAKKIITECSDLGVRVLTLYAFSTENWMRPAGEVSLLMKLLRRYLRKETENLKKKNIRFSVIGDLGRIPKDVLEAVERSAEATKTCTGLNLIFALSYGSRLEMTQTVRGLAREVAEGRLDWRQIDETLISANLSTAPHPDPDLIIRTSGEQRLSNFLMWQSAYSELYFTPTLWPDFGVTNLHQAFASYSRRDRRFGTVGSHANLSH